jgi:hypothetical protein
MWKSAVVDSVTLHVAARRYLMDRYDELVDHYAALPDQGRAGFGYRPEAYRIFPRYNVVEAMLAQVERLDPDRLPDQPSLLAWLVEAAATARSSFTEPVLNEVAATVMAEERRLFSSVVREWAGRGDLQVQPLPYRRVLTSAESVARQQQLQRRWGLVDRSWHPMIAAEAPPEVLILVEAVMWELPEAVTHVRTALRAAGSGRVTELREYGEEYLIDVDLVAPRYTGAEGVWSDDTLTWVAYASHEGTVAFGGQLAAALPTLWPDLDRWRWSP